jgi:hypothetical protein
MLHGLDVATNLVTTEGVTGSDNGFVNWFVTAPAPRTGGWSSGE